MQGAYTQARNFLAGLAVAFDSNEDARLAETYARKTSAIKTGAEMNIAWVLPYRKSHAITCNIQKRDTK